MSNPILPDAAARRSAILCSAVPHQQSRRALNLPVVAVATLIVADVLMQLVWRVGLRRHVEWVGWASPYSQQDYGRLTVPEIGPSSQFSVGAECFPHLLFGTVTR